MGLHSVWANKKLKEKKWSFYGQRSECQTFPNILPDSYNGPYFLLPHIKEHILMVHCLFIIQPHPLHT